MRYSINIAIIDICAIVLEVYRVMRNLARISASKVVLLEPINLLVRDKRGKSASSMSMMSKREKGQSPDDQGSDIITYVRQMLAELRTIAAGQKEEMLVYLIEMAAVEASDIVSRRKAGSYGEIDGNEPAWVAMKAPGKI
jgi:hypothetical protein